MMNRHARNGLFAAITSLLLASGFCSGSWIGQPFWDSQTMTVWASSEFTGGLTAVQTVAGYEGTLIGDLHNNNGTGYGMWLTVAGGGGAGNPSPSGTAGAAWIAYNFGAVYELDSLWVWNYNQSVGTARGFRHVFIEYSRDGYNWVRLGAYEFAKAPGTDQMPHNIEIDFAGVRAKYVVLIAAVTDGNWGDPGPYYGLSEVRFFGTPYGAALNPYPGNGAVCVDVDGMFTWTQTHANDTYDLYLGTDLDSVRNAQRAPGDIDADGTVDFEDVLVLGSAWLLESAAADLTQDLEVTFEDFAVVAADWMESAGPEFKLNTDSGTYQSNGLETCANYFWRIDIRSGAGDEKGEVTAFSTCCGTAEAEYYIAPDGNDANPGSSAEPLASLEGARDLLRCKCPPPGGTTVYLRGGRYFRTDEFQLTAQDSGKPGKPITYRAFPGEDVRIIGGIELPSEWFTVVTSASPVWARLDAGAQGHIYQCDLALQGITNYGNIMTRRPELSLNSQRMPLSRWPNSGYEQTVSGISSTVFRYSGTRPGRWLSAPDPVAGGYWYYGWHYEYSPIDHIDAVSGTITLQTAPYYGLAGGKFWCVQNLLEEIDTPGEWYLDRTSGILYFWPPEDIAAAEIIFSILGSANESMIKCSGTSAVSSNRVS